MIDLENLEKQITAKWITRDFNNEVLIPAIKEAEGGQIEVQLVADSVQARANVMAANGKVNAQCTMKVIFKGGPESGEEYLVGLHPGWHKLARELCDKECKGVFTLMPWKNRKTLHLVLLDENDNPALIRRWHPSAAGGTFAFRPCYNKYFDKEIRKNLIAELEANKEEPDN